MKQLNRELVSMQWRKQWIGKNWAGIRAVLVQGQPQEHRESTKQPTGQGVAEGKWEGASMCVLPTLSGRGMGKQEDQRVQRQGRGDRGGTGELQEGCGQARPCKWCLPCYKTNDLRNLLNIEFSVLKTVLLIPSLIVPPKLPGLCSGISITLENKTSPVLPSCKNVISHISSFTFRGCSLGKDVP